VTAWDTEGIELLIALAGFFTSDDGNVTIRLHWWERPGVYLGTCKVCRRQIKRGVEGANIPARQMLRGRSDLAAFLSRHDHVLHTPAQPGGEG
jgi:hypothetical protein